jgi:dolichyl-diphosphooligosaccharide--protein glycosyltransferase
VLVAMLLAWTAFAWTRFYRPIIELSTRAWRSELVRARGPLRPSIRLFDQAGRWLERHTPVTRGYLDVSLRPEYGVLAPWNAGHLLRYRSKRPMVIDNFGPYAGRETFDSARAYFAATEEEAAIGVLERLGVRYVIGVPGGAGIWADLAPSAMSHRLALGYGSWMSTDEVTHIPGLARHRMLYYTQAPTPRPPRGGAGQGTTSLGIWEVVRGARIEGRTGPGARVRLSLPLVTSSGLQTTYQRTTVADARGRYAFVVPYPTDVRFSPDVDTTGGYWLQGPGGRARLAVPEEAIRTGAAVRAPRI